MSSPYPPTPPPTPSTALSPRRLLSGRLGTAVAILAVLVIGLVTGEPGFAVVVAALAGAAAVDLANRLDPSQPEPLELMPGTEATVEAAPASAPVAPVAPEGSDPVEGESGADVALQPVSPIVVAAGSVVVCLSAAVRLDGVLSHFLGLAVAIVLIGLWGMARTGSPGLIGALGRSAVLVFICGFGAAHAVVLRMQEHGLKLAWFLVAGVVAYEVVATIFEAGTVQLRPGQNRPAPLAGSAFCILVGLVASQVANPPLSWDSGALIGLSIALAAAAGRAVPALFVPERREGGIEIGGVAATLFVAAPVAYYVARVVL